MGLNIIMFTFDHKWADWENAGFSDRSSNIAKEIGRSPLVDKLLVINSPTSVLGGFPLKPFFSLEKVSSKTFVLHQRRILPRDRYNYFTHRVNAAIHDRGLISVVGHLRDRLNLKKPVLWLSSPLQHRYIGRFSESLSVYDAIDDWTLHPSFKHLKARMQDGTADIGRRADVIFAVSPSLVEKFSKIRPENKDVHWIPNAVDDGIFAPSKPAAVPADLAVLNRPILGYVGNLQERLNVELLEDVCRRFPAASLALIGPVLKPRHFARLDRYSNAYFLGSKNHSQVPAYIKAFDVCLLPHIANEFTIAMDPVKMYEYLAAGKPVVATKIPGLEHFKPFIYEGGDTNEFIEGIARSLVESGSGDKGQRKKRVDFALKNCWANRIERMTRILTRLAAQARNPGEEAVSRT